MDHPTGESAGTTVSCASVETPRVLGSMEYINESLDYRGDLCPGDYTLTVDFNDPDRHTDSKNFTVE